MKRRQFIAGLGSAAAWPVVARAQQPERMRRIGILLNASANDPEFQAWVGAFLQGLALLGWAIGSNVRIELRWAEGNAAEVRRHAAELVMLQPDVILAHGASTVTPLLQATRSVPIVFPVADDPVGAGLVDSLARPGGNAIVARSSASSAARRRPRAAAARPGTHRTRSTWSPNG
jgi:putative tryptophan/tyrosine transport system substrate-binding protein